ncbi:uncharacterized protein G2W53_032839 [Senna tora]|uniref:Uncharacterized protein n=1 Tax=Senna tora TaxID=362788 RepID=A0A834W806_9FABA|nr:uncharacterized protein G2W53_032839 [Senna tora]
MDDEDPCKTLRSGHREPATRHEPAATRMEALSHLPS